MISMDKKYRTRDGRSVRILCVDKKGTNYPVVALVAELEEYEIYKVFTDDGRECKGDPSNDLIEVRPDTIRYARVYADGSISPTLRDLNIAAEGAELDDKCTGIVKITVTAGGEPTFKWIPKS